MTISRSPRLALCALALALLAVAPTQAAGKPKKRKVPTTKVTITVLPESSASVEIPALPLPGGQVIIGTGTTELVPIGGALTGGFTGYFRPGRDIAVKLRGGRLNLGGVSILKDPACGGATTLRLNPASGVTLDPKKPTSAVLRKTGAAQATANVRLRLAFDSRLTGACDAPLQTTGYADTPFAVKLTGRVATGGLLRLSLESAPTPVTIAVCLTPDGAATACGAPGPAGYPVRITVRLVVRIDLKAS